MPILKPKKVEKPVSITVKISESLNAEVDQYTQFAGFDNRTDFIVQAIEYVINRDKEFKKFKKEVKQ